MPDQHETYEEMKNGLRTAFIAIRELAKLYQKHLDNQNAAMLLAEFKKQPFVFTGHGVSDLSYFWGNKFLNMTDMDKLQSPAREMVRANFADLGKQKLVRFDFKNNSIFLTTKGKKLVRQKGFIQQVNLSRQYLNAVVNPVLQTQNVKPPVPKEDLSKGKEIVEDAREVKPITDFSFNGDITDLQYFKEHKLLNAKSLDKTVLEPALRQAVNSNFVNLYKQGYVAFSKSQNVISLTAKGLKMLNSPELKMALKIAKKGVQLFSNDSQPSRGRTLTLH